jgi:hypothetical protein
MDAFVLQDWVTIRGPENVTVTQSESEWLDLGPYEDVIFWLQLSEVTSTPTLLYQTSPNKDEAFFAAQTGGMTGAGIGLGSLLPTTTVVVTQVFAWSATFPLARYVRWQIIPPSSASFDVTMRILVAAVAPKE